MPHKILQIKQIGLELPEHRRELRRCPVFVIYMLWHSPSEKSVKSWNWLRRAKVRGQNSFNSYHSCAKNSFNSYHSWAKKIVQFVHFVPWIKQKIHRLRSFSFTQPLSSHELLVDYYLYLSDLRHWALQRCSVAVRFLLIENVKEKLYLYIYIYIYINI